MLCRRLNTLAVAGSTIYCSVQPCNIPILKCISCQCWGQTFSSLHKESEQHFGFKHRNDTNPIAIAFMLVLFPIIFKTSIGAVALAAALAARVQILFISSTHLTIHKWCAELKVFSRFNNDNGLCGYIFTCVDSAFTLFRAENVQQIIQLEKKIIYFLSSHTYIHTNEMRPEFFCPN